MADAQPPEVTARQESHTLRVGLLQTAPTLGAVDRNVADILELRQCVGDVEVAVTPELSLSGYGFAPHAAEPLTIDDPRLAAVTTQRTGVGLAERNADGKPWNSYLLPLGNGDVHLQRKLHPVPYAPWNEHETFAAGQALTTANVHGARVAVVICNDMWHPVLPWSAAHRGAEIIVVPVASASGGPNRGVARAWSVIIEHTALLLQSYVVFVNRCGTDGNISFWGGSRVVGPDGETVTQLDDQPGAAVAALDLARLRAIRAETPLLAEADRQAIVSDLLQLAGS